MRRAATLALIGALLLPARAHAVAGRCVDHVCSSCPHGAGDMCAGCACDGGRGGDVSFANLFRNLRDAMLGGTPEQRAAGQRRNAAANAAAAREYQASVKILDDKRAAGERIHEQVRSVRQQIAALQQKEHGNGAAGLTPPPSVPLTAFTNANASSPYADRLRASAAPLLPAMPPPVKKPNPSLDELRSAASAGKSAAGDAAKGTLEPQDAAKQTAGDVFDHTGTRVDPNSVPVVVPDAQPSVVVTPEMIAANPALGPITKERGEWQAKAAALQKQLDGLDKNNPQDQVKRVQVKDDLLKAETQVRTLNRAITVQISRTKTGDAPK